MHYSSGSAKAKVAVHAVPNTAYSKKELEMFLILPSHTRRRIRISVSVENWPRKKVFIH
jgi:hypothetical protein